MMRSRLLRGRREIPTGDDQGYIHIASITKELEKVGFGIQRRQANGSHPVLAADRNPQLSCIAKPPGQKVYPAAGDCILSFDVEPVLPKNRSYPALEFTS